MKFGILGWSGLLSLSAVLCAGTAQSHAADVSVAISDAPQAVLDLSGASALQPIGHLDAFSIELVVRAQGLTPEQAIYRETGSIGQLLMTSSEQGQLHVQVIDATADQPLVDHVSTGVVFNGQVHHVVLSVEQGIASLYVNGQLDSTFPYHRLAGPLDAVGTDGMAIDGAEVVKGNLQQVTVRTQPLSVEQIRERSEQVRQVAADLGLHSYVSADGAMVAQADPLPAGDAGAGGVGGAGGAGGVGAAGAAGGAGPLSTAPIVVGGLAIGGVGAGIAAAAALSGNDSSPRSPSQPSQPSQD